MRTRNGAPPVDLIGGDELCDLLKEYGLGVDVTERVKQDIEVRERYVDIPLVGGADLYRLWVDRERGSDEHVAAICRALRVCDKCVVDEWSRAASSRCACNAVC